jgi:hypothetical protein
VVLSHLGSSSTSKFLIVHVPCGRERWFVGWKFIGTKLLDLHVPVDLELGVIAEQLMKWKQRGALKLSYIDDDYLPMQLALTMR